MTKNTSCLFYFSPTMNPTLHPIKTWLPSKPSFTLSFAAIGDRRNSHHAENMVIACTHADCHWALFAVKYGSNCFFHKFSGLQKQFCTTPQSSLSDEAQAQIPLAHPQGWDMVQLQKEQFLGALLSVDSLLSKTATNTCNFTQAKPPFF